jgi:hypothetical protein
VGTELNLVNRLAEEVKHEGKIVQFMAPTVCMCSTMQRIDPQHLAWTLENLAEGKVVNQHQRARARGDEQLAQVFPSSTGAGPADAGGCGLSAGSPAPASRRRQMAALVKRLDALAPEGAPLIIAGDFNDWRNHADDCLTEQLGVTEAFVSIRGRPARSFPSTLPVLRLDRIYVRGFSVDKAEVHYGQPWSQISDHAALTAQLRPR